MKKIHFTKMHGAGNDFVLVDDRDGSFPERGSLIAALAADHTGISCEGVILLRRSERADFRMTFYTPDGTEAELCGNGARCAAAFAKRVGAVKSGSMTFETGAGLVDAGAAQPSVRDDGGGCGRCFGGGRLSCGRRTAFHRTGQQRREG